MLRNDSSRYPVLAQPEGSRVIAVRDLDGHMKVDVTDSSSELAATYRHLGHMVRERWKTGKTYLWEEQREAVTEWVRTYRKVRDASPHTVDWADGLSRQLVHGTFYGLELLYGWVFRKIDGDSVSRPFVRSALRGYVEAAPGNTPLWFLVGSEVCREASRRDGDKNALDGLDRDLVGVVITGVSSIYDWTLSDPNGRLVSTEDVLRELGRWYQWAK